MQSRYSCIEEWDSLYAMWMYEMMELSGAEENVNDHWRPVVRAKGLTLPILLKVSTAPETMTLLQDH